MSESKKIKFHENDASLFSDFRLIKVLNENAQQKCIFVHGRFGDSPQDAVILMEKTPFSHSIVCDMLQDQPNINTQMENDIYKTLELFPRAQYNGIKLTLIYPATEKHLAKYSSQKCYIVNETPDDYKKIVQPYIQSSSFSHQWVYNILEKKSEVERIIFEDTNPQTGFVLVPDMKWDGKQVDDLYVVAFVQDRSLRSLRDLTAQHIPLLENVREHGLESIRTKYGINSSSVRMYFHYVPSYYHLHIHFTHLSFDAAGTHVGKAVLLDDVLDNLRLVPDFYQHKTMTYILRESDQLFDCYQKVGRLQGLNE